MDIPNLSTNNSPAVTNQANPKSPLLILIITLAVSLATGFWISRLSPATSSPSPATSANQAVSVDKISSADSLKIGTIYGNQSKNFKDRATGVIEKGSINGEGTHILIREGGLSQRASLTSSVVDLDLFVGKTVEVTGETNASTKTSWLMDVGTIKIIQ